MEKPTKEQIAEKVRKIISQIAVVRDELIKPESRLIEDLTMDDMDIVDVAIAIEEEFEVTLPDEFEESNTVAEVLAAVEKVVL